MLFRGSSKSASLEVLLEWLSGSYVYVLRARVESSGIGGNDR